MQRPKRHEPNPGIPSPTADHWLPSQRATFIAGTPPALVKLPPTYRFVPSCKRARATVKGNSLGHHSFPPLRPLPSDRHWLPSQRATLLTSSPLMLRKLPPTTIRSSKANIVWIRPYPKLPLATSLQP